MAAKDIYHDDVRSALIKDASLGQLLLEDYDLGIAVIDPTRKEILRWLP